MCGRPQRKEGQSQKKHLIESGRLLRASLCTRQLSARFRVALLAATLLWLRVDRLVVPRDTDAF